MMEPSKGLLTSGNSVIKISMMNGDAYNHSNQLFNTPSPQSRGANEFSVINSLSKSGSSSLLLNNLPPQSSKILSHSSSASGLSKSKSRSMTTSIPMVYTTDKKERSYSISSTMNDDESFSSNNNLDDASELFPQSNIVYSQAPSPLPSTSHITPMSSHKQGQNHGRLVSGAQFRLLSKNNSVCTQCESGEKTIKKLKETIRSLKLTISRHEETLKHLKINSSQVSDPAISFPTTQPLPSILNPLPVEPHQHEEYEKKSEPESKPIVNQLPTTAGRVGSDPTFLTNEISKLKKMLNEEKEQAGFRYTKLLNDSKELEDSISKLKEEIEEKNKANNALKSSLETTEHRLRDSHGRVSKSEAARDELERKLNELHNSIIKNLETELKKNEEAYLKNIDKIQNNLKSKELHSQQLEKNLSDTRISRDNLVEKLQYLKEEVLIKKDQEIESNKLLIIKMTNNTDKLKEECSFKDKKIEGLESDKSNLLKKIHFLEDQYNKLLEEMKSSSENNLKALQKSIAGSIKLCVVAPTVNVHLSNNDDKWKFKSDINKEKLKQFLDTEIFTEYSFLFKQETDTSSPLGPNPNLEVWLQKLLSQMQNTIENHVQSAVNGASL